MLPLLIIN